MERWKRCWLRKLCSGKVHCIRVVHAKCVHLNGLGFRVISGLYWGNIGMLEKKMETNILE